MTRRRRGQASIREATDPRADALRSFFKDAEGPGPKRERLHRALLKMIELGFWNPGDRLPTDLELTDQLPLSLVTVQAGLNKLAEQGLITREKRRGSYVASEEKLARDFFYFRFIDRFSGQRLGVSTTSFDIVETDEIGPWSDFFGQRGKFLRVSRSVRIGDKFNVFSKMYFADPKIWALLDIPKSALKAISLQQTIHIRFGLPVTRIDWRVSFDTLDKKISKSVGVKEHHVAQRLDALVSTVRNVPLVFHRIWVPQNPHTLIVG